MSRLRLDPLWSLFRFGILFWLEFLAFTVFLLLALLLGLQPYARKTFLGYLEERHGLKADVRSFLFSPTGHVWMEGLSLEGGRPERGLFRVELAHLSLRQDKSLPETLWREGRTFSWKNVACRLKADGLQADLEVKGERIRLGLDALRADQDGPRVELHAEGFRAAYGERNLRVAVVHASADMDDLDPADPWNWLMGTKRAALEGVHTDARPAVDLDRLGMERTADGWKGFLSGVIEGRRVEFLPFLRRKGGGIWELSGEQSLPAPFHAVRYRASGIISTQGSWTLHLQDDDRNTLDADLGFSGRDFVATWVLSVERLQLPFLPGAPLLGRVTGGLRLPEAGGAIFLVQGRDISGGPLGFRKLGLTLKGGYDGAVVTLEGCRAWEEDWSAEVAGRFRPREPAIDAVRLDVKDFPLTRYSPVVDGRLSVRAEAKDGVFSANAFAPCLNPDKDPLQRVENLQVAVESAGGRIRYEQKSQQDGYEYLVGVELSMPDPLRDILSVKRGRVRSFRARLPLFDLFLAEEAPANLDLFHVEVPAFHVDDRLGRLRHLKGSAWIPFLQPRKLLIKADEAELDMGSFPVIARSPLTGRVRLRDMVWDNGWSLVNLRASLAGEDLVLTPGAVLPEIRGLRVKGRVERSTLVLERVSGLAGAGGTVEASGSYRIFERTLDLSLAATGLSYESPGAYRLTYGLPDLRLSGPVLGLSISGPLVLDSLRCTRPVKLLGDTKSVPRPEIEVAGQTSLHHSVDLEVRSTGPLELANNAANLSFLPEHLRVRGPLLSPVWIGALVSTTGHGTVRVPLPMLRRATEFDLEQARLVFNGESEWNPMLRVQAEKEVEDALVTLQFEGRLGSLSDADFQLASAPPRSREQILSMLLSGNPSDEDPFRPGELTTAGRGDGQVQMDVSPFVPTPLQGDTRVRGDEVLFEKDFPLGRNLTLSNTASVSPLANTVEVALKYRLARFVDLELSRKIDEPVFTGVRFSKRADALRDLLRREARVEPGEVRRVMWRLDGLPRPLLGGQDDPFEQEKGNIEEDLRRGRYDLARSGLRDLVVRQLHWQGYPAGTCGEPEFEDGRVGWSRRGGGRRHLVDQVVVRATVSPGRRQELAGVRLQGWPAGVPWPEDAWLEPARGRPPLYDPDHLAAFRESLLQQLAEHGYPAAKIRGLRVVAAGRPDARAAALESGAADQVAVEVDMEAGPPHTVEQLVILGVDPARAAILREVSGYRDGLPYRESDFRRYRDLVQRWYDDRGWFGTEVRHKVFISRHYTRTSLHIRVKEGRCWSVGRIRYEGLLRTREDHLAAQVPLKEGAAADRATLGRSLERLSATGLFDSVAHEWRDTDDPAVRDLVVRLHEMPRLSTSIKLGYESEGGFQGSWRGSVGNLWGRGRTVSAEGRFTDRESLKMVSYMDPFFLRRDLVGELAAAQRLQILSGLSVRNESWLLQGNLSKWWREDLLQSLALIYQEDKVDRLRLAPVLEQRDLVPSLRLKLTTQRRSSRPALAPQPGFQALLKQSAISYLYRSGLVAYQGDYTLSWGLGLGRTILTAWQRWGHTATPSRDLPIPLADRFFLGGPDSLRGYAKDGVSGPDGIGGESMTAMGVQWSLPFQERAYGFVFHEAGQVFPESGRWSAGHLRATNGLGAMIRTPVGPLQFYYGQPVADPRGRFGLRLGMGF